MAEHTKSPGYHTIEEMQACEKFDFLHLSRITLEALAFFPPFYLQSFLGPFLELRDPEKGRNEFWIINPLRPRRALRYLAAVLVPSFSATPPSWPPQVISDWFWQETEILPQGDRYNNLLSFPDEQWFFINGFITNTDLAQVNSRYLVDLFHRPITLIQNATDGIVLDLYECALGKEGHQNTESAKKALPPIYAALKDCNKKKVVVICHSQGTIIMAVVLRALEHICEVGKQDGSAKRPTGSGPRNGPVYLKDFAPLTDDEWKKLEIYCFANCANKMQYYKENRGDGYPVPWIENFANEYDFIARLGMLAPNRTAQKICIDGPYYVRCGKWGHLLNHSYLKPIDDRQRSGQAPGCAGGALPFCLTNQDDIHYPGIETPRLFHYINGGTDLVCIPEEKEMHNKKRK